MPAGRPSETHRVLGYRERQVLAYTQATIAEHGVSPNYPMICRELGIATPGEVSDIVSRLERKGMLAPIGAVYVRGIGLNVLTSAPA